MSPDLDHRIAASRAAKLGQHLSFPFGVLVCNITEYSHNFPSENLFKYQISSTIFSGTCPFLSPNIFHISEVDRGNTYLMDFTIPATRNERFMSDPAHSSGDPPIIPLVLLALLSGRRHPIQSPLNGGFDGERWVIRGSSVKRGWKRGCA